MSRLDELVGLVVVIALRSPYVCLGLLKRVDADYLDLRQADLHDLRDSDTTHENYVAAARETGVKRNRKRLLVVRAEVVAISALDDVVDE